MSEDGSEFADSKPLEEVPPELKIRSFSSKLKEEPVVVDGNRYKIKEMLVGEKNVWRNNQAKRVRADANGRVYGIGEFKGLEEDLICRCMYTDDGYNRKVTKDVVAGWGSSLAQEIYVICLKVNGLTDESETAEKNG